MEDGKRSFGGMDWAALSLGNNEYWELRHRMQKLEIRAATAQGKWQFRQFDDTLLHLRALVEEAAYIEKRITEGREHAAKHRAEFLHPSPHAEALRMLEEAPTGGSGAEEQAGSR